MRLTLDLTPETEHRLRATAARRGLDVATFVQAALREKLDEETAEEPQPFDPERWEAALQSLAQGAERLPVLPPETLTRAGIYQGHD